MCVGVIEKLYVPWSLSTRPGQFSCRLLVLSQVDLPTQDSSLAINCLSNTQASLLGSNIAAVFPIAAREFTLYLCV